MHIRAVLTLAALLVPLLSAAEVFRCTDPAGKVEYSDSACVGATGKVVIVNQNVFPGPSAREQELVDQNRRLRRELDEGRSMPPSGQMAATGRTDADLAAEKSGSYECRQARKNYEFAAASKDMYRNTQADELAVYVACGIRPPDRIVSVTGGGFAGVHRAWTPGFCDRHGCRDGRADRLPPRQIAAPIGTRSACSTRGCL